MTVVDAKHVALHLDDSDECQEQIAFADVILLEQDRPGLEGGARGGRGEHPQDQPLLPPLPHEQCDLDLGKVLGVRAFDLTRALEIDPNFLSETAHEHDTTITSVGVEVMEPLDEGKLDGWLRKLVRERGTDIFRMKGILSIQGKEEQVVMQGVHMIVDGMVGRPWGTEQRRSSRFVFIGRNLDCKELTSGFQSCVA